MLVYISSIKFGFGLILNLLHREVRIEFQFDLEAEISPSFGTA
jgi:hypothetical protein